MGDVKAWLSQDFTGTVETGGAPWWRLIQKIRPDIRTVTVRRPIDEIIDSLRRLNLTFDVDIMSRILHRLEQKLDQIEHRIPNVLAITFDDLATEEGCAKVFSHCLGVSCPLEWYDTMAPLNIQINFMAVLRYLRANSAALQKVTKIGRHQVIADMRLPMKTIDGVTIQQEPFETFYRDGRALFAEHLIRVGEAPDAYAEKNIPLMRALYDAGAMQITTVRSNGRMFGYLMAIISPSLEFTDRKAAIHTTFYTSSDLPGFGMKLQRASVEALRVRGIDESWWLAGSRGDGPRMEPLYQRLGAEEFGRLFKLNLMVH